MTRFLSLFLVASALWSQPFNSGSTGTDGALNLVTPGTVVFDPAVLNIDADGDNVFNFTTINIGPGVTVQLLNGPLRGKSVVWLASGAVTIAGTISVSGQAGYPINPPPLTGRVPAAPGPGGYQGGVGNDALSGGGSESGRGPGGGGGLGGGASHAQNGSGQFARPAYGNAVLVPLRGGSGGGGGNLTSGKGGGGGGGGGALRIASSLSVTVTGSILANGGDGGAGGVGGFNSENGGGGSGGGIHLIAPAISGAGTLRALGGAGTNVSAGSVGRIRLDATTQTFTGSSIPTASLGLPYAVPLPTGVPALRVVSVAGIPVPANPTGSFTVPDLVLNQPGQVPIVVEARNIPINGTAFIQLILISEGNPDRPSAGFPALVGTVALSTGTVQILIPPGYSRGYVIGSF